ncbi:MAG: DUF1343 domain-containing protein [Planctomycetota bacterium]
MPSPPQVPPPQISVGLERCLAEPPDVLRGARFGLLCNQASVDRAFGLAPDLMAAAFPGQLAALFGPQHGFASEQQDNMIETAHARDARLGVPIHSLYAETRKPTRAMLEGLDLLVVDLQDVGCRVYTYVWTLLLALEACADAGVAVLVLDRPNPLGDVVEGAVLDPAYASFVGMHAIPMRHGATLGQLARLLVHERRLAVDLHVLPSTGVQPSHTWRETGRAWIPPSPNLPRVEGVDVYCGQVLLEGTNLSEGRGTTTPFELFGAPFVEPYRLRDALRERELPGVVFRPVRFEPTFQKWQGQSCGGLFVHVVDRGAFRPYATTLAVLSAVRTLWPTAFAWRAPPYEYETHKMPIDILTGGAAVRTAIDAAEDPGDQVDVAGWRQRLQAAGALG